MCRDNYYHYGVIVDTIMDYIGEQTVSKYPTSAECKAARFGAEGVLYAIEEAPAADVEEVKHGRWIEQTLSGEATWCCSECKTIGSPHWKRCPVCEAKMDGGKEDER